MLCGIQNQIGHSPRATVSTLHRGFALAVLACLAGVAYAQIPDPVRGRALYENHCMVCHTGKVHARPNRIVLSRRDAADVVNRWQTEQKLRWGQQEIDDVVEYLARTVYKFD